MDNPYSDLPYYVWRDIFRHPRNLYDVKEILWDLTPGRAYGNDMS